MRALKQVIRLAILPLVALTAAEIQAGHEAAASRQTLAVLLGVPDGSFALVGAGVILWFTAFVGANLLQSSLTKWCLMEDILRRLGCDGPKPPRP